MRGHQWEAAEGTIVDVESSRHQHTYIIEALNSRNVHVRGTVKHKGATVYPVGSKVRIELDEHNQMRFDANAPGGDPLISTMTMADQIAEASAAFDRPRAASASGFDDLFESFASIAGTGDNRVKMVSSTTVHVTGPDGRPIQVDPAQITQLTQGLLSGDPAARQAAIQHLQEIKAVAQSQMGSHHAGMASAGGASGSAEKRLATLEDLRAKGMLTQSEYEAQRQRIIDTI